MKKKQVTKSETKSDRFRRQLKAGAYADLASARKSISKTQGLSEKERDAQRKLAEKSFR